MSRFDWINLIFSHPPFRHSRKFKWLVKFTVYTIVLGARPTTNSKDKVAREESPSWPCRGRRRTLHMTTLNYDLNAYDSSTEKDPG